VSEELVPQGLPHGERKNTVTDLREAGVRVDRPESGGTATPSAPTQAAAPPRVGFDPLLEMNPMGGVAPGFEQPTFEDRIQEAAVNSPNPMVREAARRILEYP